MAKSRSRRKSLGKRMNPIYYVFCEGKTEEAYVSYLKSEFRHSSPKLISKISGSGISNSYVREYLKRNTYDKDKDKLFLMYDGDIETIQTRLSKVKKAIPLLSTPCIELWFLLHLQERKTELTSDEANRLLTQSWSSYKKGYLKDDEQHALTEGLTDAISRAEEIGNSGNPSSTIALLIKEL